MAGGRHHGGKADGLWGRFLRFLGNRPIRGSAAPAPLRVPSASDGGRVPTPEGPASTEEAGDSARPGEMTSEANPRPKLTLYGYSQCPFCARVLRVVADLGLEIKMRNTQSEPERRRELIEATGRGTVPVLRIESPDGEVSWMPESVEIIEYLKENAA